MLQHLDKIIELGSVVGVFLTSIFSFWNIMEMKHQRRDSHLPIFQFSTIDSHIYEEGNQIFFDDKNSFSKTIILKNVGTGVARNVFISWKINYKRILRTLEKLKTPEQKLKFENNFIEFKSNSDFFKLHFINAISMEVQKIASIATNSEDLQISIPPALENILSILFYLYYDQMKNRIRVKDKLSRYNRIPVKVLVRYADLDNKVYKKYFFMSLNFEYMLTEIKDNSIKTDRLMCRISML